MGWLFSIIFLIGYFITHETGLSIAAGLFAIAGSIGLKGGRIFYERV